MSKALLVYSQWLEIFPYRTKMITSGLLFALSDIFV